MREEKEAARLKAKKQRSSKNSEKIESHGIIRSMPRKGNWYDNCIMETSFGRLKNETYDDCEEEYPSFMSFSQTIGNYIHSCNNERTGIKTKWMSPVKCRGTSIIPHVGSASNVSGIFRDISKL